MYIERTTRYYIGAQQAIRRANFLILIKPASRGRKNEPIKALVRQVACQQFGHWMMGTARIYSHSITISGSYGGDGGPALVPDEVYDRAGVILPDRLFEAWNKGGGWNSAGSEAEGMREWARDNLKELRR